MTTFLLKLEWGIYMFTTTRTEYYRVWTDAYIVLTNFFYLFISKVEGQVDKVQHVGVIWLWTYITLSMFSIVIIIYISFYLQLCTKLIADTNYLQSCTNIFYIYIYILFIFTNIVDKYWLNYCLLFFFSYRYFCHVPSKQSG